MKVISAGADYLTLTNIVDGDARDKTLLGLFEILADPTEKWQGGGYKGWQCLSAQYKFGSRLREDGRVDEILIAPGASSETVFDLYPFEKEFKVTRLDLQLTVLYDGLRPDLAEKRYDKLESMRRMGMSPLKRRKTTLIKSTTGTTLYLGTRRSGRKFFRLYDKSLDWGAELGAVWREEIQFGRDLAQKAFTYYLTTRGSKANVIDLVSAEFTDACSMSLVENSSYGLEDFSKEDEGPTGAEKKLRWLEKCVKPTIAWLIEHELETEARDALGMRGPGQGGLPEKPHEFSRSID